MFPNERNGTFRIALVFRKEINKNKAQNRKELRIKERQNKLPRMIIWIVSHGCHQLFYLSKTNSLFAGTEMFDWCSISTLCLSLYQVWHLLSLTFMSLNIFSHSHRLPIWMFWYVGRFDWLSHSNFSINLPNRKILEDFIQQNAFKI